MSWTCTTEEALRCYPDDFDTGRFNLDLRQTAMEDVGDEFINRGTSGWPGLDGTFAEAFGFLAMVAGRRIREFAARAGAAELAHLDTYNDLVPLETESDQLLIDAQDAESRLRTAEGERDSARNNRSFWYTQRDNAEAESEAYEIADRNYWNFRRDHEAATGRVTTIEGELDAFQIQFDRIRTDEDESHQRYSDRLNGIYLEGTHVDVSPSGAAESLGHLLDVFDAALLGFGGYQYDSGGWARLKALQDARDFIADSADIDLEERDARIRDARLLIEIRGMTPEELARLLEQAFNGNGSATAERLADLLRIAFRHLSPEELDALLSEAGGIESVLILLAAGDGDLASPELLELLLGNGAGLLLDIGLSNEAIELINELFPNWHEQYDTINDLILGELFDDILASPGGFELIEQWANGDLGHLQGHQSAAFGEALLDHLAANPEDLASIIDSGSQRTQDFLEWIANSDPSAADWNRLTVAFAQTFPLGKRLADAGDGLDETVWRLYGHEIGAFQAQIDEVGGAEYDPAAIAEYLIRLGVKELPGGQYVDAAWEGVKTLIGGYQGDDTYQRLGDEERADQDRKVIAMVAAAQSDPAFAQSLEAELASIDADSDAERIEILLSDDYEGDTSIATRIEGIALDIEQGREAGIEEAG